MTVKIDFDFPGIFGSAYQNGSVAEVEHDEHFRAGAIDLGVA